MRKLAALVAPVLLAGAPAFGAVVYQQSTNFGTVNINGNAIESLGDDVTLAGTERDITSIDIGTRYFFDATHLAYAGPITLSLYDTTTPGTPGTGPGQLIAQSTTTVSFAGTSGSQDQIATFLFPGIENVPNTFYLAVSQDVFDNNFALQYGPNPTIGTTATTEFFRPQPITSNFQVVGIGGVTGLVATINAVPEPASLSLVAAAGLLGFRRRRQA